MPVAVGMNDKWLLNGSHRFHNPLIGFIQSIIIIVKSEKDNRTPFPYGLGKHGRAIKNEPQQIEV